MEERKHKLKLTPVALAWGILYWEYQDKAFYWELLKIL